MSTTIADSDDVLLAAARNGDRTALDALVSRHLPRVQRFSMKMCGEAEDANDVSQDTFMTVAKSLPDFRGHASFSTWLYAIARSFCVKKRRRSKYVVREDSFEALTPAELHKVPHAGRTPEEEVASSEVLAALDAAIATLEPKYREVLVLRDMEGLTAQEVAEVLHLNVNTVKTRLHRARATIRERLKPVMDAVRPAPLDEARRCTKALRLFSRNLEGELTPEQCAEMSEHLAACPVCEADCRTLKRALALCRSSRPTPVPPALRLAIQRSVHSVLARRQ